MARGGGMRGSSRGDDRIGRLRQPARSRDSLPGWSGNGDGFSDIGFGFLPYERRGRRHHRRHSRRGRRR